MQTHDDLSHAKSVLASEFIDSLTTKAERMQAAGLSKIAGGAEGEQPLDEWERDGIHVRQMPNDEHGILRISVGGGETPVPCNYCVFRGRHHDVVDLLRKALRALEYGPK